MRLGPMLKHGALGRLLLGPHDLRRRSKPLDVSGLSGRRHTEAVCRFCGSLGSGGGRRSFSGRRFDHFFTGPVAVTDSPNPPLNARGGRAGTSVRRPGVRPPRGRTKAGGLGPPPRPPPTPPEAGSASFPFSDKLAPAAALHPPELWVQPPPQILCGPSRRLGVPAHPTIDTHHPLSRPGDLRSHFGRTDRASVGVGDRLVDA